MFGLKLTSGSGIVTFVGHEEDECVVQIGNEPPSLITIEEDEDGFIEKMMKKCTNITSDSLEEEEENKANEEE